MNIKKILQEITNEVKHQWYIRVPLVVLSMLIPAYCFYFYNVNSYYYFVSLLLLVAISLTLIVDSEDRHEKLYIYVGLLWYTGYWALWYLVHPSTEKILLMDYINCFVPLIVGYVIFWQRSKAFSMYVMPAVLITLLIVFIRLTSIPYIQPNGSYDYNTANEFILLITFPTVHYALKRNIKGLRSTMIGFLYYQATFSLIPILLPHTPYLQVIGMTPYIIALASANITAWGKLWKKS
jgi:hypothetical protein